MKIKRYEASDMRQAMRLVREEQGPDAVILSSRRTDEGFEIIAAVDYDESLIRETAIRHGPDARIDLHPARPAAARPAPMGRKVSAAERAARLSARKPGAESQAAGIAGVAAPPEMDSMKQEIAELRDLLESQFSSFAWQDFGRRNPVRARMLREFTRMGLDADIAGAIAAQLPEEMTPAQSRYLPMGTLADRLHISSEEPIDGSGMIALVGPTGVGKTTTLAKLAARHVLRHGLRQVALVTTDDFRIGAEEQLFHYGRLLGVPVFAASGGRELSEVLARLTQYRLVLIDTPGLAHGDPRLEALGKALAERAVPVKSLLVLASNAQSGSLERAVHAYAGLNPAGCILTKLDEASLLGGALSVAIRHDLRIDYLTDGQRVPEDIARPQAHRLVCRALRMLTGGTVVDDNLMAERFGRVAGSFA